MISVDEFKIKSKEFVNHGCDSCGGAFLSVVFSRRPDHVKVEATCGSGHVTSLDLCVRDFIYTEGSV